MSFLLYIYAAIRSISRRLEIVFKKYGKNKSVMMQIALKGGLIHDG